MKKSIISKVTTWTLLNKHNKAVLRVTGETLEDAYRNKMNHIPSYWCYSAGIEGKDVVIEWGLPCAGLRYSVEYEILERDIREEECSRQALV